MGQKVNPTGFRLGISKKQNANWYATVSYTHLRAHET